MLQFKKTLLALFGMTVLFSEQDDETFLREVVVVRENFGDAACAQLIHRDAIGQAITFVEAIFVKVQPCQKVLLRYDHNLDARISENGLRCLSRIGAQARSVSGKEVENFDEHIIGSY